MACDQEVVYRERTRERERERKTDVAKLEFVVLAWLMFILSLVHLNVDSFTRSFAHSSLNVQELGIVIVRISAATTLLG